MIFNVPQFIDVEDKIAGPFTAKQLLWIFAMGGVLLVMWYLFEKAFFVILSVPVVLIFLALAFYRPYNQPLIKFIFFGLTFLVQPKIYSWKRVPVRKNPPPKKDEKILSVKSKEKKITPEYLKQLSKAVDNPQEVLAEKKQAVTSQPQTSESFSAQFLQSVPTSSGEKKGFSFHSVIFSKKTSAKPSLTEKNQPVYSSPTNFSEISKKSQSNPALDRNENESNSHLAIPSPQSQNFSRPQVKDEEGRIIFTKY